jgi:deoxyribodipyrimidine photo-lyase
VTSLDRLYAAAPVDATATLATDSVEHLSETTALDVGRAGRGTAGETHTEALDAPDAAGLTVGYGDPVALLARFVDRGWSVLTMATPTGRYGKRRDDRVRAACGDAVRFVSGDGLVRNSEWSRTDWQDSAESWLAARQHTPSWDESGTVGLTVETGVTPALVDDGFDIAPTKTDVPTGTHREATSRLRGFVDRIDSYPGNISAPQDAREGTSGLSPYLNFGLLSIRQVYQHVTDNAPASRARDMFVSRLYWNLHYNQKLADWAEWTDRAVNPVLAGFNDDHHDRALVEAWKTGHTGFPMVDAAMRCLRQTGWLNFRMRAMCASFFTSTSRGGSGRTGTTTT